MVLKRSQIALFGLSLALGGAVACSSDDSNDTTNGDGDSGDGDTGDGDSGDGDTDVGLGEEDNTKPYTGIVVESTNVSVKITSGQEVAFFDPTTGEVLDDPAPKTSDSSGKVTFEPGFPIGMGRFVKGGGVYTDTWNYPPARLGEEELIRLGSASASIQVPQFTGYDADPEAAPVAGSVMWRNKAEEKDEMVGCATIVEGEGVEDVRYFMGNLPTDLLTRSLDQGTVPPTASGLNDGEAGKYFIGNVAAGKRTLIAKVGDKEIGRTTIFVHPRKDGSEISDLGEKFPSVLALANILVDDSITENPTPKDCE